MKNKHPKFLTAPQLSVNLTCLKILSTLHGSTQSSPKMDGSPICRRQLDDTSAMAKGISPDIEVLQEVPEELKARIDTRGEASLRGHLKTEGDEQTGSQSYIAPDPKDDKALHTALDLIRGIQKNSACWDLQALSCP
jgi:hypothetical protein